MRVRGWRPHFRRRHFRRGSVRLIRAAWLEPGEKMQSSAAWSRGVSSRQLTRGAAIRTPRKRTLLSMRPNGECKKYFNKFSQTYHSRLCSCWERSCYCRERLCQCPEELHHCPEELRRCRDAALPGAGQFAAFPVLPPSCRTPQLRRSGNAGHGRMGGGEGLRSPASVSAPEHLQKPFDVPARASKRPALNIQNETFPRTVGGRGMVAPR